MKRIKKKVVVGLIILAILIAVSFIGFKIYKYLNSNEYHLKELGYNKEEINEIIKLDNKYIETILSLEYSEHIIPLFQEKYFILSNLNKYLNYKKENKDLNYTDIVAVINVGSDKDWYTEPKATNLDDGYLILVNKFNYLPEDYTPEDLVKMGLQYAFSGKEIREEVYASFKRLVKDAKAEDLTIVANSTFRTYNYQENLYNRYKANNGKEYADSYAARAGHSEHQTGLAIDVSTLNSTMDNFEETEEFEWLQKHAHEYGFILRYPKGKEFITGYNYESWHYRYVGVDIATKIKNLGITYDEYYAYFLKNK